jgi:hypothetical protein
MTETMDDTAHNDDVQDYLDRARDCLQDAKQLAAGAAGDGDALLAFRGCAIMTTDYIKLASHRMRDDTQARTAERLLGELRSLIDTVRGIAS